MTVAAEPRVADDGVVTAVELLLVEDNDADAVALGRALKSVSSDLQLRLHHVRTLGEGLHALRAQPVDIVLLDLGLPDGHGVDNLRRMLAVRPVPIVILTGRDDESIGMQAVRSGAQDYVVKGCVDGHTLMRVLRYALERYRMAIELKSIADRQSELKDRFLSHVSHELRTPLTAIHEFVGILRDGIGGPVSAKQAEYLGVVSRNVVQLRRMISDLMEVTRIGSGKLPLDMGLVDINACVTEAIEAVAGAASAKQLEVTVERCPNAPSIHVDAGRVTQVVVNLLGNAIKHTPVGGRVGVRVVREDAESVRVTVHDTGCGVPPEHLPHLFERLYQVRPNSEASRNGLGLGLYISYEIVKLMGGELSANSEVGRGSEFHVRLPVYHLRHLVARVLGATAEAPCMTLISVAVRRRRSAQNLPPALLREVARAMQSCVIESSDAVIPESVHGDDCDTLFAIARADASGANAIAARLREHLAQLRRIEVLNCSTEVAMCTFDNLPGPSAEARVLSMTELLQAKLQSGREQP